MVEPEYDSAYRRERHFERLIFMIWNETRFKV